MLPLFVPGVPGGPELVIVSFILLLAFGGGVVLIGGALWVFANRGAGSSDAASSRRVEELERRVEALESKLDDE